MGRRGRAASWLADDRWRLVMLTVGSCGAVACGAVAVLSFIPAAPVAPTTVLAVLFVGVFPAHLRTIAALNEWSGRRRSPTGPGTLVPARSPEPSQLPRSELGERFWWVGIVLFFAFVSFFSAMNTLQDGSPTVVHGLYFLDDHGSLTRISYHAYVQAMAAQERIFAAFSCFFYSLAVAANGRPRDAAPRPSGDQLPAGD
jgi:hypothetical protein